MTAWGRKLLAAVPWAGFALASAGLWLAADRLATARSELAAARGWQAAVLQQLGRASTAPGAPAIPVPAESARDALARIIAARDGAMLMATDPAAARPQDGTGTSATATAKPAGGLPDGEISRLTRTHSTGSAAGDARIIEQDSRSAWTGWK